MDTNRKTASFALLVRTPVEDAISCARELYSRTTGGGVIDLEAHRRPGGLTVLLGTEGGLQSILEPWAEALSVELGQEIELLELHPELPVRYVARDGTCTSDGDPIERARDLDLLPQPRPTRPPSPTVLVVEASLDDIQKAYGRDLPRGLTIRETNRGVALRAAGGGLSLLFLKASRAGRTFKLGRDARGKPQVLLAKDGKRTAWLGKGTPPRRVPKVKQLLEADTPQAVARHLAVLDMLDFT